MTLTDTNSLKNDNISYATNNISVSVYLNITAYEIMYGFTVTIALYYTNCHINVRLEIRIPQVEVAKVPGYQYIILHFLYK